MKKLLLILLLASEAIIVTSGKELTTPSDDEATTKSDQIDLANAQKSFVFNNDDDDTDEKSLEVCSERATGAFTIYDYSVVLAMLVVSLKIGLFYGFLDKKAGVSSSDFMLGSQMGLFPVTLSLATSFVTAIELLGNPAEMFFHGTQYALIGRLH